MWGLQILQLSFIFHEIPVLSSNYTFCTILVHLVVRNGF